MGARVLAFVAILLAGAAGAFIGYAFIDLQTTGDATVAKGIGALVGAVIAAGGTAIVVVLTLRAMSEWRTIQDTTPKRNRAHPRRRQPPTPSGSLTTDAATRAADAPEPDELLALATALAARPPRCSSTDSSGREPPSTPRPPAPTW